jgi:hypothetical protein
MASATGTDVRAASFSRTWREVAMSGEPSGVQTLA